MRSHVAAPNWHVCAQQRQTRSRVTQVQIKEHLAGDALFFQGSVQGGNDARRELRQGKLGRLTICLEDGKKIEATGMNSTFRGDILPPSLDEIVP